MIRLSPVMTRRGNISANGLLFPLSQSGIGIGVEHIPLFKAMKPQPKITVTRFGAGAHSYWTPEKGLPLGIAPAVARFYHDVITGGFYAVD